MSAEDDTPMPPHKLDYRDVADFLASIDATFKCEICGNEDFGIITRGEGETVPSFYYAEQGKIIFGVSHPCFLATCSRCGNTKVFDRQPIDNWKAKRLGT